MILKNQEETEIDILYTSKGRKLTLTQIETSIDALEFIEKVKGSGGIFSEIKLIPCQFMRSICIRNINPLLPLVDIHYALQNLTQDLKKIILVDDTEVPGINQKICFVEYNSFHHAKNAISILNSHNVIHFNYSSQTTNHSLLKVLSSNQSFEAVWCEPLVDCAKEILKNSPLLFFENLHVNNYNIFHFKQFLENYLKNILNVNFCIIKNFRQYTDKVMVEFSKCPEGILDSEMVYEGRVIHIVPAMRPNSNVGKYRDKASKASVLLMKDEDKKLLLNKFNIGESYNSNYESVKKLADNAYNRIMAEDRKEKERERVRKRSKSNSLIRQKRQRREEEDSNKLKDLKNGKRKKFLDSSTEKESRSHREIKDQSIEKKVTSGNSSSMNSNPQALLLQGLANTSLPNSNNMLNQITSLLMNNPSSANLFQNFSALANLQSLISNPGILTAIQQLSLLNQAGGGLNNPSNPLLGLLQMSIPNSGTINSLSPNSVNQSIPLNSNSNIHQKLASAGILNLPNMNNSSNSVVNPGNNFSSQANSLYNLHNSNANAQDNAVYFPTQNNQYGSKMPYFQQPANNQPFNYSLNGMMGMSSNQNEMFMNQPNYNNHHNLQDYGMVQGQPEIDNEALMIKKYYEMMQNMNNKN